MDLISALQWSVWKTLADQEKQYVFNQVTMYFVSPLLKIADVQLADFELFGVKCRTFVLTIEEEEFVFVPGNPTAILGWDSGSQGLQAMDLLLENPAVFQEGEPAVENLYDLTNAQEASDYINDFTSPLRKAAIPPMLVQREAIPAGTTYAGTLDMITGEYFGDVEFYDHFEIQIKNVLFPKLSERTALDWEYPEHFLKNQKFYLELQPNQDKYRIYRHHGWDYQGLLKHLYNYNFDLLTEDQWEFACGAGTRRLFRWGNELVFDDSHVKRLIEQSIAGPNMFGLFFDTSKSKTELTADPYVLKLTDRGSARWAIADRLPLASYYRSDKQLDPLASLDPVKQLYRKAVIIAM